MTNPFQQTPKVEAIIAKLAPMMEQRVYAQILIGTYQRCLREPDFFYAWLEANIGDSSQDTIDRERAAMPARIQALRWGLEATEWK